MKRTFISSVFIFLLIFAFFIPHLNAQAQPAFTGQEPTISMDFKDASLKDILKALSIQSGMNFIASEAVKDRKITLYFDKVPLAQVMNKIFGANNLSYELDSKANIFVVKDWGNMEIETVTKVFNLKYATVSSSSFKEEMSNQRGTTSLTGSSSESTSSSSSSSGSSDSGKWKVESDSGITSAVKKLLTNNIGSCMEDFRTNSLIVTDTPSKMQIIAKVIASLDTPVPQVVLEVEMLDVSKNLVDKLGFEFGESPLTAIITGATASTGFPFQGWSKIFNTGDGTLSINSLNPYQMQLHFLRTQSDTKYLARPRLLTLNNETAEISITKDEVIGREDTLTTTAGVTTTSSVFKRSTDLALSKEGTGIFLRVTPQINLEKDEITMVISPKTSVSTISPLSTTANQQADIEVRFTKSIVKVKDGETVVLGGLIHQDKAVTVKKLPILGDIPILGMFFRYKNVTKDIERELLVFITPRIVKDKVDIKLAQVKNIQMPVREQGVVTGITRDYIINSNMNKFENKR